MKLLILRQEILNVSLEDLNASEDLTFAFIKSDHLI